ncbi:60S acidic ribosomal P2B-like, partial [Olea europaea subsp. europaea]
NYLLLLSQLKDKDVTEVIAVGREKLASVPTDGSAVVVAIPAAAGGAVARAITETKKEEKERKSLMM